MNNFQAHLQDLLNEKEMNRKELANKLNISTSAINGYFHKNLFPTSEIAIKIADFFGCSLDYLLGLTEDRDFELTNTNRSFIENYNILLKERGLSIAKSLREMNMGDKNYTVWKKGKIPKTYNLITIAKYFGVSVDFLLGRSEL